MRLSHASFRWFACFLAIFLGVSEKTPDEDGLAPSATEHNEEDVIGGKTNSTERALTSSVETLANAADLVAEWDKHMEGFNPELLLTFPLSPRTDEFFYEDVPPGPSILLRGGFFASSSEGTSSIEFSIMNPAGDVIFERHEEAEGLFHFRTTASGTYTFVLGNHKWLQDKIVTFAVGKGNDTHLQSEHLETLEDQIRTIDRTLIDIQTESTYLWIRQKSHMIAVETIHSRVLAFCIVEFVILVAISGFQVYYIKGLLSDRRIL